MAALSESSNRRNRSVVPICVLGLFVAACAVPAVRIDKWGPNDTGIIYGVFTLTSGWIQFPLIVPWLANPLLLAGAVCFWSRKDTAALVLGWAALGMGLMTPLMIGLYIQELLVGFFLWLGSLTLLALAATWMCFLSRAPCPSSSVSEPGGEKYHSYFWLR